jgi:hypothetical protein
MATGWARAYFLAAAVLAFCALAPAGAAASISCNVLDLYRLDLDANGHKGAVYACGSKTANPDGSYSYKCKAGFSGEPEDRVNLTCKDRHLTFTRTRSGAFTQNYSGWMYEGGSLSVAGDFSHNSASRTYGWCGELGRSP